MQVESEQTDWLERNNGSKIAKEHGFKIKILG
jgi:hypothetical protein